MGYLDNTTGILGGMLPMPHQAVRVEIGPWEDRVYVAYSGRPADLLAAGAIDAHIMDAGFEDVIRDSRLRPCRREILADGAWRVTRTVTSLHKACDLPGIAARQPLGVGQLKPRERRLRLVKDHSAE
jgi:hypothetical protein